jgi:hypothetical protein
MINKVAHRGNTNGRSKKENHPSYIQEALNEGYLCEIDVWAIDKDLFLGHDYPKHKIVIEFLKNDKLFCHAKNIEALQLMISEADINCFWHENDKYTVTSHGYIWKYPEIYFNGKLWGICSDQL